MKRATSVGIASLGLHLPSLVLSVEELAKLRSVDANEYLQGLGCHKIALCPTDYSQVDLLVEAARRALSRWNGDLNDIGMIAVGTESATDMSRPLSAWVAEKLGLKGKLRSYEVKHACYGGTLALRQATEWKLAGVDNNKAALVIAGDISLYEEGNPSEPTQGAGAIAFIIDQPLIAEIDPVSYPWSEPVFDSWHPANKTYPQEDRNFSLECYIKAAHECFHDLCQDNDFEKMLNELSAMCFHTPFPKMVKKVFYEIGKSFGLSDEKIEYLFAHKVEPTMEWNRLCGNAYTASLWIAVANTLRHLRPGEKITAFSYGSGCGAELLTLTAGQKAFGASYARDIQVDLKNRKSVNAAEYAILRKTHPINEK
jgi:hydroxymethylglutaryl-CoA synthase